MSYSPDSVPPTARPPHATPYQTAPDYPPAAGAAPPPARGPGAWRSRAMAGAGYVVLLLTAAAGAAALSSLHGRVKSLDAEMQKVRSDLVFAQAAATGLAEAQARVTTLERDIAALRQTRPTPAPTAPQRGVREALDGVTAAIDALAASRSQPAQRDPAVASALQTAKERVGQVGR